MPSEDSEDEDYNPGEANCHRDKGANIGLDGSGNESASDPSVEREEDSDSNSESNDEEYSKGSLLEELAGIMENGFNEFDEPDVKNIEDECALIDEDGVVINEKRQRKEVDYKKLHDVSQYIHVYPFPFPAKLYCGITNIVLAPYCGLFGGTC